MIPKMDRCHSDMCIPEHITLVICVSPSPNPSKQVFYFCCFCEGDYKWFKVMSNIIDKRATIRDNEFTSSTFFVGRNVYVNL